ncbi:70 kDa peptidyl-prolyl isomerase [Platanthera zijinensis]|uniref:70 kDa peptidyl-prolyl isomerase n=1 Tax=Platanthera zijinensis TaxID=2320716 RepID=A0AAP0B9V4_9ASPA
MGVKIRKPLDKDIYKDGGIFKKIFEREKWENPKDHDEVLVKYEASLEDGALVSKVDEAKAIKTMKKGEKMLLTVTEIGDDKKILKKILKEGEGYEKTNDGSTMNDINFSTLVLDKESWDMNTAENIEAASRKKEEGNALFKLGKSAGCSRTGADLGRARPLVVRQWSCALFILQAINTLFRELGRDNRYGTFAIPPFSPSSSPIHLHLHSYQREDFLP